MWLTELQFGYPVSPVKSPWGAGAHPPGGLGKHKWK
jgi:hypothetical protein